MSMIVVRVSRSLAHLRSFLALEDDFEVVGLDGNLTRWSVGEIVTTHG